VAPVLMYFLFIRLLGRAQTEPMRHRMHENSTIRLRFFSYVIQNEERKSGGLY